MISSYILKDNKFISITNSRQIKTGDIVDLYANGINHYFKINSLLPNYAKNWLDSSNSSSSITSFNLIDNNLTRPYFEYRNDTIGFLGWIGETASHWYGGARREFHNVTQEVVKHPLILAIPAALIAAPLLIPALGTFMGATLGAVGSGITTAYAAAAGAVGSGITTAAGAVGSGITTAYATVAPVLADVGSDITAAYSAVESTVAPIVSEGAKLLSPIEKFGGDILHDILPVAPKVAGKVAPTLLSTIEGDAAGLVGDVAKTIGTGLAVSLASKLLSHNSPQQILSEGATDSGYNQQQSQAYSNQYQNSLSRYASQNHMTSSEAMNQTAAYVYSHLRDYISHGYTTAKQAIFATLKKTGGIPPTANTPISSILGSSNSIEKYVPLLLIGGAGLILIKLMGDKKNNRNMEMANV